MQVLQNLKKEDLVEQIQKNTILDSFYAEFYKLGYASTNYAFYELETLLYIAKLNNDQNLLVDFSKEGSLARYLQNNDENIVEAEELLANVRIYNDRIQEFYKEFVKFSAYIIFLGTWFLTASIAPVAELSH